jgi:hypothetical protein
MTALIVGLGCFLAHALVSLVWLRLPGPLSLPGRHAVSAIGTHTAGIVFGAHLVGPFAYWPAAAVSGFGAVCWLFAFSAVYKSVSFRILTRLSRLEGRSLSLPAITEEYVRPEFEQRTRVLAAMNCAHEANATFAITARGRAMADRLRAIQRACGIERSGLYAGTELEPNGS